jgi:hypothetical protein
MRASLLLFPLVPAALLSLSSHAVAQVYRAAPADYADAYAYSSGTGTVFGGTKGRMMGLYVAPLPSAGPIFEFGFRGAPSTSATQAFTLDVELTVESTSLTPAQLDKTFANNVGANRTVILPRQVINLPARSANASPHEFVWFKPAQPFIFTGPNLLVDFKRFDSSWSSRTFRNDRTFSTTSGNAATWGQGCGAATIDSSSSNSYLPGSTVDFELSGAPASTAAIAFIGFNAGEWGPIPLPLALDGLGMPGCLLMVSPDLLFATGTDANGDAKVTLPIPQDNGFSKFAIVAQWMYADASANAAGLLTSDAENVRIGPLTPSNRYVYDLFSETDPDGSLQDGGPILGIKSGF